MEAFEIVNYLSEFSSLNAEGLEEEIEKSKQEIEEIEAEIEYKAKVVQVLDEEINELKPIVEDLEAKSEKIHVDQIRTKTQRKKTEKETKRMNIDPSRTKLDATENDKRKLTMLKAKLALLRKLLNIFLNSENKGFVINPGDMQLQLFQLNMNRPIEENSEVLWNSIGNCSENLNTWEILFNG